MTATLGSRETNRRTRDWEAFDEIKLKVVPRYKTSELSGDEWRTGVAIEFYFKGHLVHEDWFTSMRAALMMLLSVWIRAQEPIPDQVIELERKLCDQPGCTSSFTKKRYLKRLACNEGWLDKTVMDSFHHFRKFCARHLKRGDCGLEDNDDNYTDTPYEVS
jgi:hypothetical protein